MASEAEVKGKLLAEELAKANPDQDIVYYLQTTSNYWNTIDTSQLQRGYDKLKRRQAK